jgi:hypothetical protein
LLGKIVVRQFTTRPTPIFGVGFPMNRYFDKELFLVQKGGKMNENNAQRFFGIVIPKELLENRELSLTDKFVYGYIASYKNWCFESNSVIADKLGISASGVSHSIAKLAKMDMIFIERTNGNDARRKLYPVFNKPNKLAYLKKIHAKKTCGKPVENFEGGLQNLLTTSQNLLPSITGERFAKFATIEYRIKRIKQKNANFRGAESPSKALVGAFDGRPRRSRNSDNFEQEFYERNTIRLGAI